MISSIVPFYIGWFSSYFGQIQYIFGPSKIKMKKCWLRYQERHQNQVAYAIKIFSKWEEFEYFEIKVWFWRTKYTETESGDGGNIPWVVYAN